MPMGPAGFSECNAGCNRRTQTVVVVVLFHIVGQLDVRSAGVSVELVEGWLALRGWQSSRSNAEGLFMVTF